MTLKSILTFTKSLRAINKLFQRAKEAIRGRVQPATQQQQQQRILEGSADQRHRREDPRVRRLRHRRRRGDRRGEGRRRSCGRRGARQSLFRGGRRARAHRQDQRGAGQVSGDLIQLPESKMLAKSQVGEITLEKFLSYTYYSSTSTRNVTEVTVQK